MSAGSRARSKDLDDLLCYEHDPLPDAQWLRILRVEPAPRGSDEMVKCVLEHTDDAKSDTHGFSDDLAHLYGYEALSWCWGLGDNNQSIRITKDNRAYHWPVYAHLYEALLALRDTERPRYLWIDAICINQADIPERNLQVSKMSDIYGDARNVCIWLGKATRETTEALIFIKKHVLEVYSFDELCRNEKYIDSWNALLALMKLEWFGRRWIVQEVALARRATMHCGSERVDWQDFAAAVSLLVDVDTSARRLSDLVKKDEKFGHADNFFYEVPALSAARLVDATNRLFKKAVGGIPQRTNTLEDIVARFAMLDTSEPRDTIYALLALAKDSQPSVAGIPDHLDGVRLTESSQKALHTIARLLPNPYRQSYVVEYKQPIVDVYQQFIAFAIARSDPTRALDIICRPFARSYTKAQDVSFDHEAIAKLTDPNTIVPLPSWIPNVSEIPFAKEPGRKRGEGSHTEAVFSMQRRRGDAFVSSPDAISYCAAGSKTYDKSKVRFRKRRDHYSMFVEGFVLDTIHEKDAASQLGNIPSGWLKRGQRHSTKTDEDTFWRTLVADRGPKGSAPLFYKNVIRAALQAASSYNDYDTDKHIRTSSSEIVSDVLRRIQATIWGRRLIETEQLKLLGLAPEKSHKDDLVCILYGCSVPVILRKVMKTAVDIANENQDDEEERLERQAKLVGILRKIFAKRNEPTAHSGHVVPRALDSTEQPAHANSSVTSCNAAIQADGKLDYPSVWLQALLQPLFRQILFLAFSAIALSHCLNERLTAGSLALIAIPHTLTSLRTVQVTSLFSWDGLQSNSDCIVAMGMVIVATAVVTVATGVNTMLLAAPLLAIYSTVFPDVLPPAMALSCQQILQRLAYFLSTLTQYYHMSESVKAIGRSESKVLSNPISRQQTNKAPDLCPPAATSSSPAPKASPISPAETKHLRQWSQDDNAPQYYYELIGECYVHTMMDGEAIRWQNESVVWEDQKKRVKPTVFELR